MKGGNRVDGSARNGARFAPIEFPHRRDPVRFQKPAKTQGYHEGGAAARGQAAQRGEIEVVVMIVAQQDRVDGR